MSTFTLSIETAEGKSFQHPYHLGTIERVARDVAAYIYNCRVNCGMPVVTVALIRDRKVFDVFYGDKWQSEMEI